jgi:hypothetical protein
MPKADPGPTSAPRRYFYMPPLDELRVSLPADAKEMKEPAKGKIAYPAYGEEPRRAGTAQDRTIVITAQKKGK